MATIGLRDLYRAPITTGTDGVETYGEPKRLAKAISAEISVNVAKATLYADDGVDEEIKEFTDGTIKLNMNDLEPADYAELLGQAVDSDGVVYAGEEDDAPYFAIGFRAKKPGSKLYRYIWLYKVKFEIPSESFKTKGNSVEFSTPEINGTFIKRADGNWKADATAATDSDVAKNWFTAVREKSVQKSTQASTQKNA